MLNGLLNMAGANNPEGTPVWVAALSAAACRVRRSDGVSAVIQWLTRPECVRYTATDEVTVEPFGIALTPGATLELRWPAGETAYRVAVREGAHRDWAQGNPQSAAKVDLASVLLRRNHQNVREKDHVAPA